MEKIKENLKSYHLSSDEVETLLADYGNKITPVNYAKLKKQRLAMQSLKAEVTEMKNVRYLEPPDES
jgi:hypothetical protein